MPAEDRTCRPLWLLPVGPGGPPADIENSQNSVKSDMCPLVRKNQVGLCPSKIDVGIIVSQCDVSCHMSYLW